MGSTLRVMSANLWNGRADAEAFANLVSALAVDVVAVQEISPEQAEALSSVMPYGELHPGRRHEGMGIALQRPGRMSELPMAPRPARVTHLDPADWPQLTTRVEILNIHVMAPHILFPWPGLGFRPGQVRALERHLTARPNDRRVVVGDFNATPIWPVYRRIRSHLTDAAVAVAERMGRSPARTWGPWHGSPRLLRIDHGFLGGLHAEDFRVVTIDDSDHSAIVMDVSIQPAATATRGTGDAAGA